MGGPLRIEELDEELCEYCPLDEDMRGTHCYGGLPVMCCDSGNCDKAYEAYLEQFDSEEV